MKTIINYLLLLLITFFPISTNAQWTSDADINTLVTNSESGDMKALGMVSGKTYVVYWKAVAAPIN